MEPKGLLRPVEHFFFGAFEVDVSSTRLEAFRGKKRKTARVCWIFRHWYCKNVQTWCRNPAQSHVDRTFSEEMCNQETDLVCASEERNEFFVLGSFSKSKRTLLTFLTFDIILKGSDELKPRKKMENDGKQSSPMSHGPEISSAWITAASLTKGGEFQPPTVA